MKECSVYCRPDEGIHVYVVWTSNVDRARRNRIGRRELIDRPNDLCHPVPCWQTPLSLDAAVECQEESPFPNLQIPLLATVLVEPIEFKQILSVFDEILKVLS